MQKLSKQLSQVRRQLEDLQEDHFSGILAEDLLQQIEKAIEYVSEVAGALKEAGL